MKINITKGIDFSIDNKNIKETFSGDTNKHCEVSLRFDIEGYDHTYRTGFSWYFHTVDFFTNKYFDFISYASTDDEIKNHLFYNNIFLVKNWNWETVEKMILNLFEKIDLPNSLSFVDISEFLLQMDHIFYMNMRDDAFWHNPFYADDDEIAKITFSHAYEGCQFNHEVTKKIYDLNEYRPKDENFFDLYLCFDIKLPSGYETKGYLTLTTPAKFKARYDTVLNNSSKDFELAYKHLMIEKYDPNIMDFINRLVLLEHENLNNDKHLLLSIGRIYHLEENFKLVY